MTTKQTRAIIVLVAMTTLFLANPAKGQTTAPDKFNVGIGGEFGLITGFEESYHSIDAGAIVQLQYRLTNTIAFTFATGYSALFSKTYQAEDVHSFPSGFYGTPSGSLGIMPLKAGIRLFTGPHFYLGACAGTWFTQTDSIITPLIRAIPMRTKKAACCSTEVWAGFQKEPMLVLGLIHSSLKSSQRQAPCTMV